MNRGMLYLALSLLVFSVTNGMEGRQGYDGDIRVVLQQKSIEVAHDSITATLAYHIENRSKKRILIFLRTEINGRKLTEKEPFQEDVGWPMLDFVNSILYYYQQGQPLLMKGDKGNVFLFCDLPRMKELEPGETFKLILKLQPSLLRDRISVGSQITLWLSLSFADSDSLLGYLKMSGDERLQDLVGDLGRYLAPEPVVEVEVEDPRILRNKLRLKLTRNERFCDRLTHAIESAFDIRASSQKTSVRIQ